MSNIAQVEAIAEKLRQEPYRLINNDCIVKSYRLKQECARLGIEAKVVICIGRGKARFFGRCFIIPVIHSWGEVDGQRIETSRPIGAAGIWGIVPVNIKPIIAIRL